MTRALELKYFCLSRWYHSVMNEKVAVAFRFRRLTKMCHKIFYLWQEKVYNFKQFHLLIKYAERQSYKLQKRSVLKKMVKNANSRKWKRLMNYRANFFLGQRMFYRFCICVELQKYHNAKVR